MTPSLSLAARRIAARVADLGFSVDLPAEDVDFSGPTAWQGPAGLRWLTERRRRTLA
jgi:hypothetical protein